MTDFECLKNDMSSIYNPCNIISNKFTADAFNIYGDKVKFLLIDNHGIFWEIHQQSYHVCQTNISDITKILVGITKYPECYSTPGSCYDINIICCDYL